MVKDETEIAQIREAIAIAERAFTVFRSLLRPSDCEKDLADALEGYVRRMGGLGTCFPPIIAVGERAALPHARPTDRVVSTADLLLVDWGVTGPTLYKSDLTRVLDTRRTSTFSPGKAQGVANKFAEVYGVVLRAQEAAFEAIRPGVIAKTVDTAARATIAERASGTSGEISCTGSGLSFRIR